MGSGGLLIDGQSGLRCNNSDDGPNGRPGRVVAGDLEISVRAPRCDLRKPFGTFSGLDGPSRVDQPPLRAVSTRPEVEVYTLRRKGDLEGVCRLRAKTRQPTKTDSQGFSRMD